MTASTSPTFTGLRYQELAQRLQSPARAKAALRWLYEAGLPAQLPEHMPGVAQKEWTTFRAACPLPDWSLVTERLADDGTTKMAVDFHGVTVETVLIPGPHRSTVCVSSQGGCTRKCAFCATAQLGFKRNLQAAEIVAQYVLAQARAPAGKPARNVVFMGMGEPMDNLDQVMLAVELLIQAPYPQLSPAHVTVSTSGVVPALRRFLKESPACLALSLNATTDEVRTKVMPHNQLWPIAELLETVRVGCKGREVFVEYVLFEGLNDTPEDAARLPGLLEGIGARINVIPFNGHEGTGFRPPPDERVIAFQKQVMASGLRCMVRWPRGRDIDAACGQLANKLA